MKHNNPIGTIGILMLDTRFPRIAGDIGNPASFPFPVIYRTIEGASPDLVVRKQAPDLLKPFINAGLALVEEGADIITTSCGFLVLFQAELEKALPVPVFTSSLLLLPKLERKFGKNNVGILTISGSNLNAEIRAAAGIAKGTPIGTTEDGEFFTNSILNNHSHINVDGCCEDNVNAAQKLLAQNPNLKALLLECTNMPPYAEAIAQSTGIPVYSIFDLLRTCES